MKEDELTSQKNEIQKIGLDKIKEYFNVNLDKLIELNKTDKEIIKFLYAQARLGMSFEKEMNLSKRALEMNFIRVFRLIAENKKELRQLIQKSIPQYLPK